MIIEKNELAVQKQIEYIKDKAGKVSELARSNKLAMFAHLSIASLIILSYIIEIFKGTRTVSYVLFVLFSDITLFVSGFTTIISSDSC